MPSVDWNRRVWNDGHDWSRGGEEWSSPWGTSDAQWYGTILPRIHNFLPANTILEIGPGFGRWTWHLKDWCRRLILVDLNPRCIEACRVRFASSSHITYHVNDGLSLDMVPDRTVDFAFSFDSLVHVDVNVIKSYLSGLAKALAPDGVGFLHHSNLQMYSRLLTLAKKIPARVERALARSGILIDNRLHCRSEDVDVPLVERLCVDTGLACIGQELLNWNCRHLIDAVSLVTPRGSVWIRPNKVVRNTHFMHEAASAANLSHLYGRMSFPSVGHVRRNLIQRPSSAAADAF